MSKPSVFVGSSTEGLEFARAVRGQLIHDAELTLWNEGFFTIGNTFIETLVNSLPRFDFAVLVLHEDDLIHSRSDERFGPRDNVVFELGLFMGLLGRSRTFVVHRADSAIKLPTDLSGLTTAQYHWPRVDNNYEAAVGPACDPIRKAITDLGFSGQKASKRISEVEQTTWENKTDIDALKFMVGHALTKYELLWLDCFARHRPLETQDTTQSAQDRARYWRYEQMKREIDHLCHLGFLEPKLGMGFQEIEKPPRAIQDLHNHFHITSEGEEYLRYREIAVGHPVDDQKDKLPTEYMTVPKS